MRFGARVAGGSFAASGGWKGGAPGGLARARKLTAFQCNQSRRRISASYASAVSQGLFCSFTFTRVRVFSLSLSTRGSTLRCTRASYGQPIGGDEKLETDESQRRLFFLANC